MSELFDYLESLENLPDAPEVTAERQAVLDDIESRERKPLPGDDFDKYRERLWAWR